MKRLSVIFLLVPLNLSLVPPGLAGTNTTVILSGVTITPSLNENEIATLSGNVGDLVLTQNDRFLNQLFLILLGRNIDPAELDAFDPLLARGTARQQIATSLLNSAEYRARVVQQAYSKYLQRDADATALSTFAAELASGTTRETITASIIGSSEYFEKRGHNSNSDFLNAVFQDLLNRPVDLSELGGLTESLNRTSRTEFVALILASTEYRQRLIQDTYTTFLHRGADFADSTAWLAALADAATDESLTASLAGSQEFFEVVPQTAYHITVDWSDGVVETVSLQPPVPQNIFFPFQVTHRYLDNKPKGGNPAPLNVNVTLHADTGSATAITQLFVKNVAPQLRNVAIPTPSGIGTVALLTGDILEPGTLDELTLLVDWGDGKGAQMVLLPAGSSSFRLTHVYSSGGDLKPNISVKDDDGAIASQSLSLFVTPFLLPEAIPSMPILLASDDSGVARNDAITSVTGSLHFSGAARPGNRVDLFANGQLVGFNTVENSGQWNITATPTLSDGTYQITARATDNANNVSLPSQPLILVIDTKPPLPASTPDLLASSDSGVSNSDNITTASVRTMVGTAEPGGIVEVFAGTNLVGIANVDIAGQWGIDESHLGPGTYSFLDRAKDRAGNASPFSKALTVTISGNLTPPSAPSLASQSDLGWSNTDHITSQTKPTFTGTSEANAAIQLRANDVIVGAGNADAAGRWSITVANALAESTYSFTAKSADGSGNSSSPSPGLTVTIDSTPPAAPSIPALTTSNTFRTANLGVVASVSTPSFTGHAEAGTFVELLVNGLPFGSALTTDGNWTIPVIRPLDDGTYQVSAGTTDVAGNKSPPSPVLAVTIKTPEARLTLTRVQNTFLLSWPSADRGYLLVAADSLSSPIWLPVDKASTIEGDTEIVILSGRSANTFFRLKKQ